MNKSLLQEFCHRHSWPLPNYTTESAGPGHDPRFTGTVTVNGVTFQTPAFECRSSKEAQNEAARLAYNYLTAPPGSAPGFSTSDANLNIKPLISPILPPAKQENGENFRASQTSSNHEDDTRSKVNYKNPLQNYAQKRNLPFPVYSCEINGPDHSRRFRSMVTIDGNTYMATQFYSTLKDAEHAAAKVAFETLLPDGVQEDEGLYKSLLQEFAQKGGLPFPVYDTAMSGPSHQPIFLSTVAIGDDYRFQGKAAKTKKQAEMSAAKVAYTHLTEGKAEKGGTVVSTSSPGCQMMGAVVVSSSDLESTVVNESQPNITLNTYEMQLNNKCKDDLSNEREQVEKGLATEKDAAVFPGSDIVGASPASSASLQLRVRHIEDLLAREEQAEKNNGPDIIAKRHKLSSPDDHSLLPSRSSDESSVEIEITGPARPKILVQPNKPNVTYSDGPVVASDENWVAVKVDTDQNQ